MGEQSSAAKIWTVVNAEGTEIELKIKAAGGTEAQYVATAKALRSAGFTTVRDENGRCILCDGQHCGDKS